MVQASGGVGYEVSHGCEGVHASCVPQSSILAQAFVRSVLSQKCAVNHGNRESHIRLEEYLLLEDMV